MTLLETPPTSADFPFTDEDLVSLLNAGDAETAMTGIQQRYGKRLTHFLQGMVRDPHLAQDLLQEVLHKVFTKHDLYAAGTNFRAWLFEIARNQALSALRTNKRVPRPISALSAHDGADLQELLDCVPDPHEDHTLEESELMHALTSAIRGLPSPYRTVFELCVQRGMSYQQAGQRLGLPTGTVAIRIMRARKRLFSALQQHMGRLRRPPACFQ
jgi:RNA polymerase sigma-70 factor (ECF subfamily)